MVLRKATIPMQNVTTCMQMAVIWTRKGCWRAVRMRSPRHRAPYGWRWNVRYVVSLYGYSWLMIGRSTWANPPTLYHSLFWTRFWKKMEGDINRASNIGWEIHLTPTMLTSTLMSECRPSTNTYAEYATGIFTICKKVGRVHLNDL